MHMTYIIDLLMQNNYERELIGLEALDDALALTTGPVGGEA
jgi:hypothetical protein